MAKFTFGMNQSLDGYIDHQAFSPEPLLFSHFVDSVGALAGSIYGRVMYETMRYWDVEDPSWGPEERAFAQVWRRQPKWVASRTLTSVGPNATLIDGDVEAFARRLKAETQGEIEVSGPTLAASLAPLIDEYRLYLHPVVVGGGKRFFAGPRPPLRLLTADRIGEALRLAYAPA